MAKKLIGEILVGTTNIELVISNTRTLQVIESVQKNMQDGSEIYDSGTIPLPLVHRLLAALQGFRQLLTDYDVQEVRVWGSEMFAHATNAEYIADQIYQATGFTIDWLNSSQEVFYRNQAIRTFYPQFEELAADKLYIIGMSTGRLDIGYYAQNDFRYSRSVALGPVRIAEEVEDIESQIVDYPQFLRDFIASKIADFTRVLPNTATSKNLLLVGSIVLNDIFIEPRKQSSTITLEDFSKLQRKMQRMSQQAMSDEYDIEPAMVRYVLPELFLLERAFMITHAQQITLVKMSVGDGLIFADSDTKHIGDAEIITSARDISTQYRVEAKHRDQVEDFALHLFDQLKPVHQLNSRERLLLNVVSLVHDIGSFVNSHAHYLHSEDLIRGIDFHGLSTRETEVIAAVARYHSSQTPDADEYVLQRFNRAERLLIAKLTAMLRVADALDDSRGQKIQQISVSLRSDEVIITAVTSENILLESWVFQQKAKFFMDVFGIQPILKKRTSRAWVKKKNLPIQNTLKIVS